MKDNLLEFYVNNFCFLNNSENIDISFIPPILRRKTTLLDKITLSSINRIYSDDIQNIVFSSQLGETERLIKVIEQYQEDCEVSPNVFSASVHNYPIGFFLLNIKKAIPYNALSGTINTISSGFLASVTSNYDNTLYCYSDVDKDIVHSYAIALSKKDNKNSSKYRLTMNASDKAEDNFDDFINLFSNKTNCLETSLFKIERIR